MTLSVSFLFSAMNLQIASKKDLMCINGIGVKKAEAIIKYRKTNKLQSIEDLLKIKGFGKALIANVKSGKKTVACGGKGSARKSIKKEIKKRKASKKEIVSNKIAQKVTENKKTDTKMIENKKVEKATTDTKTSEKKTTPSEQ